MSDDDNATRDVPAGPGSEPLWPAGAVAAPAPGTAPPTGAGPPPQPAPPGEGFDERRPAPRVPGTLAAAGGLLMLASLSILISQLPKDNRRITGLLLSLAFEAVGILALVVWRHRPAVTVGVALSAIGVLPVLVFAFIDPNRPNVAFGDFNRGKGTLTAILAVSAAIWLLAYLIGPGRRFAIYLGAALAAVWLLLLLQIATTAIDQSLNRGTPFGPDESFGNATSTASTTTTRIGVVSLVVGVVYLLVARLADRRGGTRVATPFFATAAVILAVAVFAMISPWKAEGASVLAIALGVLLIWLGSHRGRRFTAWYGAFGVVAGTLGLVLNLVDTNLTAAGLIVLAAGVVLALLADWLTDRADPGDHTDPVTPLPAWSPPTGGT